MQDLIAKIYFTQWQRH